MGDVHAWVEELCDGAQAYCRFIWSRGAGKKDWKVTVQAYKLVDGRPEVIGQVVGAWPCRSSKTVEGLMLKLTIELEREVGKALVGAHASD